MNLLPWREYERVYQRKLLKRILFITCLLALASLLAIHVCLSREEHRARIRLAVIEDELNKFRRDFFPVPHVIKSGGAAVTIPGLLLDQRGFNRLFFSGLGEMEPAGICFMKIQRVNNVTRFQGQADSSADLTAFLLHWRMSGLFSEIHINSLEQERNGRMRFIFQAEKPAFGPHMNITGMNYKKGV